MTNKFEEKESKNLLIEIVETVSKEAEDVITAFWLAVVVGESAREKAENQGGDPEPEKIAFDFGLKCRGLLNQWVINQLANADLGSIFNLKNVVKKK